MQVFGTYYFHLLPYYEQANLFEQSLGDAHFAAPVGTVRLHYPGNNNVYGQSVKTMLCPSDPSVGPDGTGSGGWRHCSERPATRPMPW